MLRRDLVEREVAAIIEPVLEDMGFELVGVDFLAERGRWVLRIYADTEGGITVEQCAMISREIGYVLDVKDPISHGYVLEVSSPGLNRPLRKAEHLMNAVGKMVQVTMARPLEGRRRFKGRLAAFEGGLLRVKTEVGEIILPWKDVEKAHTVYEFDEA